MTNTRMRTVSRAKTQSKSTTGRNRATSISSHEGTNGIFSEGEWEDTGDSSWEDEPETTKSQKKTTRGLPPSRFPVPKLAKVSAVLQTVDQDSDDDWDDLNAPSGPHMRRKRRDSLEVKRSHDEGVLLQPIFKPAQPPQLMVRLRPAHSRTDAAGNPVYPHIQPNNFTQQPSQPSLVSRLTDRIEDVLSTSSANAHPFGALQDSQTRPWSRINYDYNNLLPPLLNSNKLAVPSSVIESVSDRDDLCDCDSSSESVPLHQIARRKGSVLKMPGEHSRSKSVSFREDRDFLGPDPNNLKFKGFGLIGQRKVEKEIEAASAYDEQ